MAEACRGLVHVSLLKANDDFAEPWKPGAGERAEAEAHDGNIWMNLINIGLL